MIDYKTLFHETKMLSVLLVEDFDTLRKEMSEILEDLFKKVSCASDGKEALMLYEQNPDTFDLIISDIQMPHMDGVTLATKIREIDEQQPILILSAHTDSEYLLELINIGISKFITKPIDYDSLFFTLYEECKKIRLLQPKKEVLDVISLAEGYVWYTKIRVLKFNENIIELTKHELLLLEFFISRPEYICSSEEIIDIFYQHDIELSEKNIRNLVFKLRKKIPEQCIESVYGLGYKFLTIK